MSQDLPLAYVVFSAPPAGKVPGRIRLRVPGKYKDSEYFRRVKEAAGQMPEVLVIETSDRTTSIRVDHTGDEDDLLSRLRHLKLFRLVQRDQVPPDVRAAAFPQFTPREKEMMKFLALTGLSILQSFRGHALGAGTSLLDEAFRYWDRIPADERG